MNIPELAPPLFYVSIAPWNLLGIRHWLPGFHFLSASDFCDGYLARSASAAGYVPGAADGFEEAQEAILADADCLRYVREQGPGGQALLLIFDERNEARVRAAGLSLALPPAALRSRIDDKVAATRLGDQAGVRSVPNVLGRVDGYATLRRLAAGLGPDLVIQLPFGDSGTTTYFVSDEADYAEHAAEIEATPEVKVMRRIRCREATIEACVTRQGIVVGPLCTELVGFEELTPYRGGWCGNELAPGAFSTGILDAAAEAARRIGERLAAMGYRGVYGCDLLLDEDGGEMYLGELNPRITGVTPITTQAARDAGVAPPILFHLLEWLDVPHDLDIAETNARFRRQEGMRAWGQLIVKELREGLPPVPVEPPSGIWRMDSGTMARRSFDTGDIDGDGEGLVLRTVGKGFSRERGAPIARVMTPARMMTAEWELSDAARGWIRAVRASFG